MRVCFLHGSNDQYGASRVVSSDCRMFRAAGCDVTLVVPAGGPLDELSSAGVEVVQEPSLHVLRRVSLTRSLRLPAHVPEAAREADLVVLNTLALTAYAPALRAARVAFVNSVHEILDGRVGGALARLALSLTDATLCNSRATAKWLVSVDPKSAPVVAYPVVKARGHPSSDRTIAAGDCDSGRLRLLVAGRVNGHKGHKEALLATRRARRRGIDVQLELVGGSYPGQEAHLEELLTLVDRQEGVSYSGELPAIDNPLGRCDVLLVPTQVAEPFGLVALEAWSAGKRVAANRIGGLAEATTLVDGVTFDAVKPNSFDRMIDFLMSHPDLRLPPSSTASVIGVCSKAARRSGWQTVLERAGLRATQHRLLLDA